ncbi:DUF1360 domain-containing protein [Peribacillus frigoritolerans]|nr:DUF1360 domain-containing protein [Peribacillus frigoritolerans]
MPTGQLEEIIEIKGSGIRHFIGSLLSCYWCVGFWCSLITVLIYYYFPAVFPDHSGLCCCWSCCFY